MGKIYAVRMREYNKGSGNLRRSWSHAKWKKSFEAGVSTAKRKFIPSRIYEVTREQYEYVMGRNADGRPNVGQPRNKNLPVFDGWVCESRRALLEMVQREADRRSAKGGSHVRADIVFTGALETVEELQQKLDLDTPTVTETKEATKEIKRKPVSIPKEPVVEPEPEPDFAPMDVQKELKKAKAPQREPEPDIGTDDTLIDSDAKGFDEEPTEEAGAEKIEPEGTPPPKRRVVKKKKVVKRGGKKKKTNN